MAASGAVGAVTTISGKPTTAKWPVNRWYRSSRRIRQGRPAGRGEDRTSTPSHRRTQNSHEDQKGEVSR